MKWLWIAAFAVAVALAPSSALAQEGDNDEGLILRVSGDFVLARGETVSVLVVIDGNAQIEGTVTDSVLVVEGDAVVTGTIEGDLTVISGDIDLRSSANVNNVNSVNGDIVRAQGATVSGDVTERGSLRVGGAIAALFSLLFWLGMTIAALAAGLVFAAVGGHQLTEAGRVMKDPVKSILGVVFVWVALPIIAVVAMITLVGLPLGLGVLFFLLPALLFLGFIAAGQYLGRMIVGRSGREVGEHPYLATFLGVLILSLVILVPVLGAVIALLAAIWGAGALAMTAYQAAGGRGLSTQKPAGTQSVQPEAMG